MGTRNKGNRNIVSGGNPTLILNCRIEDPNYLSYIMVPVNNKNCFLKECIKHVVSIKLTRLPKHYIVDELKTEHQEISTMLIWTEISATNGDGEAIADATNIAIYKSYTNQRN